MTPRTRLYAFELRRVIKGVSGDPESEISRPLDLSVPNGSPLQGRIHLNCMVDFSRRVPAVPNFRFWHVRRPRRHTESRSPCDLDIFSKQKWVSCPLFIGFRGSFFVLPVPCTNYATDGSLVEWAFFHKASKCASSCTKSP